jgi:hypothetical protein
MAIAAVDNLIEAAKLEEPECDEAMLTCIHAWNDLGTCRYIGMAVGAIPWWAIVWWAEFYGLEHEQARVLVDVIRQLDNDRAAVELAKERLKRTRGGNKKGR